jgi:formylglycine-generating enzyme required for sulfatase activity
VNSGDELVFELLIIGLIIWGLVKLIGWFIKTSSDIEKQAAGEKASQAAAFEKQATDEKAAQAAVTTGSGLKFVLIPAGSFSNVWPETTENDYGEKSTKAHERVVTISKPFYLGQTPVTQEQWVAVMGEGSNPSNFKGRTNPVECVSWEDAQLFIQKLNEKEGGHKYRLPTEAEWEHAARAGSKTEWFFGDDPAVLGQYAWFDKNSKETTHPVGEKKPNPWGLYDIYGNVSEWVADWKDDYQAGAVTDPTGPASGSGRVSRGGCWLYPAEDCRSADRLSGMPDSRYDTLGFRLAFSQ